MGDYFKGWKRKVGLITLVMASVFAVGWVRSLTIFDQIEIRLRFVEQKRFTSVKGYFSYMSNGFPESPDTFQWHTHRISDIHFGSPTAVIDGKVYLITDDILYRVFHCNPVPYGSIVIPLTLLSAFLLLSKPRKSTQKKITEPVSVEGK